MSVPNYFRNLARRCLVLSKTAVEPEVIEQMRVWAADFADEADQAERRDGRARMRYRRRPVELPTAQAGERLRLRERGALACRLLAPTQRTRR